MIITCISDTHLFFERDKIDIPKSDLLIHAGDHTWTGSEEEMRSAAKWLGSLPHPIKVAICGNHDRMFERSFAMAKLIFEEQGIIYLQDELKVIDGMRIFGSPWTPEFGTWTFMKKRGPELFEHWNKIPFDLDVLVTHGPPYGVGDRLSRGEHVGDTDLRRAIEVRNIKLHVCGHIHCGHGERSFLRGAKETKCVNAAICNDMGDPVHKPIQVDMELL